MRRFFISILYLLWNGFATVPTAALNFPENFIFAAATSAYQIEGAWNVDGKGENIWDRFIHTQPNAIQDGQNADDADKSYYFYKNDSDFVKEIGFDVYRFSISWARILPNGDLSEINQPGIDHYNDVIDDLLEKGIQPMVTIYHWDLPQKLQDFGGWLNSSIVDHLANYADILFSEFGDRVRWWSTINEPFYVIYGYSLNNSKAPSLGLGTPADYIITHNILLAHMRIYRLYEKKYKPIQNGRISITLNYDTCFPKTGSQQDIEAAERHYQFVIGIFAHPIYSTDGDYPKLVREIVYNNSKAEGFTQSRLPAFTQEEIISLRGTSDYFSLNHYSSSLCSSVTQTEPQNTRLTFFKDINVHLVDNPSLPTFQSSKLQEVNPKGFRFILNRISRDYNFPEIFVTENGYADFGEINDTLRIDYHRDYLNQLLEAYYYEKCNIIGYTVWSLLDSFEWNSGYTSKIGIISVDHNSTNKERTRKKSSYFFQELIKIKNLTCSSC